MKQQEEVERREALGYYDSPPNMGGWGWAWLERWMVARPWEHRLMMAHYQTILAAHAMAHQDEEEATAAGNGQQAGGNPTGGNPTGGHPKAQAPSGPNLAVLGTVANRFREGGHNFELVTVGKCKSCGRRIRVKQSIAAAAAAAADAMEKAQEAAAISDEWKARMEEEGEEGLTSEETQAASEAAEAAAVAAEEAARAAAFPPLAHLDMCNICMPTVSWAAKLGALPPAETLGEPGLLSSMDIATALSAANAPRSISSRVAFRTSAPARSPMARGSGYHHEDHDYHLAIEEEEELPPADYSHLPRFMQPTTSAMKKVRNSPNGARRMSVGSRVEPVALADSNRSFASSLRSEDRRVYDERVGEQRSYHHQQQHEGEYEEEGGGSEHGEEAVYEEEGGAYEQQHEEGGYEQGGYEEGGHEEGGHEEGGYYEEGHEEQQGGDEEHAHEHHHGGEEEYGYDNHHGHDDRDADAY